MNDRDIVEVIADQIIKASEKKSSNSSFDKTYVGTIIKVSSAKKYTIKYDNSDREFTTKNPLSFAIGDKVHIVYPENDSSKKYMVEDVVGSSSSSVSGVSSVDGQTGVVSLANSYATKSSEHTHTNISSLNNISDSKISNWDSAYSHSTSAHAPTDAEKNTIESISVNGTQIETDSVRNIELSIPTSASDIGALENDGNAVSATKATNDSSDNEIISTYGATLTVDGSTVSLISKSGVILSTISVTQESVGVETIIGDEPENPANNTVWIDI